LVFQLGAFLLDVFVGGNTNHFFAFLLAIELHAYGFLLLYHLEHNDQQQQIHSEENDDDDDDDDSEGYIPPPVGNILVQDGDGSSGISNVTSYSEDSSYAHGKKNDKKLSHEDSGSSSMASISTTEQWNAEDDDDQFEDPPRSIECCGRFSISYGGFFILAHTLSALLVLSSLNQQFYHLNLKTGVVPEEIARIVFLLSYGMFVACTILSYYKRHIEPTFDRPFMKNVRLKQTLSFVGAILALVIFGTMLRLRGLTTEQLQRFYYGSLPSSNDDQTSSSTSQQPYLGEVWVTGASIIDDDAVCVSYQDTITVNVSVVYGGKWACPKNPSQRCTATVTSQVECHYYESNQQDGLDDDQVAEEDYENIDNMNDACVNDYVYFRYHDYQFDDDNAYDYSKRPSFKHWNRPTESIIGTCDGSCIARSGIWRSDQYSSYAQSNHAMYLSLGMGLCFLGWPIFTWWQKRCRQRASTNIVNKNDTKISKIGMEMEIYSI